MEHKPLRDLSHVADLVLETQKLSLPSQRQQDRSPHPQMHSVQPPPAR